MLNDCRVAIEVLSNVELEGSIVMGDKAYGTKEIRRVATRYDKLSRSFLSFVFLASVMILLK
jgi:transposase